MKRWVGLAVLLATPHGAVLAHPHGHESLPWHELLPHVLGWEHLGIALVGGALASVVAWKLHAIYRDRA